jgi:hypothetical protein
VGDLRTCDERAPAPGLCDGLQQRTRSTRRGSRHRGNWRQALTAPCPLSRFTANLRATRLLVGIVLAGFLSRVGEQDGNSAWMNGSGQSGSPVNSVGCAHTQWEAKTAEGQRPGSPGTG